MLLSRVAMASPCLHPNVGIASEHSVIYVTGKLNGLDGYRGTFCKPGHERVTRIVKATGNTASFLRGVKGAFVALLTHGPVELHVPDPSRPGVAGHTDPVKRKQIAVGRCLRKPREPNGQRMTGES
jgi:hypothetical protein